MSTVDNINYEVKAIDKKNMMVDVSFSNGQWARIPLTLPLPSNDAEMNAIVRPYAPSKEQMLAATTATPEEMGYLEGIVGRQRMTDLLDKKGQLNTGDVNPSELTLDQKRAVMWGRIQSDRDLRKDGGIFVNGNWFHSDTPSRIQYGILLTTAIEKSLPETYILDANWKTMSGTFVTMTVGLLRQIRDEGIVLEKLLFHNAEAHRTAMLESADPDPMTYDYSAGWPARYMSKP